MQKEVNVIDFTIYKATGHRIEYGDELGRALQEIDKANRAVEETLGIFKLAKRYKSWFPERGEGS